MALSWLSVAKHQTDRPGLAHVLPGSLSFLPALPHCSISKFITLCCSYFLVCWCYPLDCEILKVREHVYLSLFSFQCWSWCPAGIGPNKRRLRECPPENSLHVCSLAVNSLFLSLFAQPLHSSSGLRQKDKVCTTATKCLNRGLT